MTGFVVTYIPYSSNSSSSLHSHRHSAIYSEYILWNWLNLTTRRTAQAHKLPKVTKRAHMKLNGPIVYIYWIIGMFIIMSLISVKALAPWKYTDISLHPSRMCGAIGKRALKLSTNYIQHYVWNLFVPTHLEIVEDEKLEVFGAR